MKKVLTQSKQFKPKIYVDNILIKSIEEKESFRYLGRWFNFDMDNSEHKRQLLDTTNRILSFPVPKGTFKCSGKRCQICPIIQEGCSFSNANDSRFFKNFSGAYDCSSTNVVYILQCTCCNKKYVGSTKTKFR